jgi:gamma-glutamylcyclotransferase (GGCT)/AIG2-like uncharacterized protein YtfP
MRAPDHIFVYGSLHSMVQGSLAAPQRRCLRWNARLAGRGMISGQLYDLGPYPAAVIAAHGSSQIHSNAWRQGQVHGELWRIRSARTLLPVLDAYERIELPRPEYARIVAEVTLTAGPYAGHAVIAWTYNYLGDIAGLPRIADGRWKAGRT